jgi:hypothetical protein
MIVLVVLFLVVMPALLYAVGWGVFRFTLKSPRIIRSSARQTDPGPKKGADPHTMR